MDWVFKIPELDISLNPKIKAPSEAGIKRQNEKLKAVIGDKPRSKPAKIVAPDRETPGRMASD